MRKGDSMLRIREESINLTARPGENVRGDVHLEADGEKAVRGEIYSDHVRILVERERFSGQRIRLRFGVDVSGLMEGDRISGHLCLATTEGEFQIPIQIRITEGGQEEEIPVRTPEEFAVLARRDQGRALRVFRSGSFLRILKGTEKEASLTALRKALIDGQEDRYTLEDFLVSAGLKEAVVLSLDGTEKSFYSLRQTEQETILLRRNTWGSFSVSARAEGEWLELDRNEYTDEDFVGSECVIRYRVRKSRVGSTARHGRIVLAYAGRELEYRVTASILGEDELRERSAVRRRAIASIRRAVAGRLSGDGNDRIPAEIPAAVREYLQAVRTRPELVRSASRRLAKGEALFQSGCTSPYLYAEAWRDLEKKEECLTSLSPFFIQVLWFGTRVGRMTETLALRAAYLSGNEKSWSGVLYRILAAAYEKWPSDGILEAVVRLILKGSASSEQYFPWFAKAVDRQIRILRLYEYYIETMPDEMDQILPLSVRKYFLMNHTLPGEMTARLYGCVIRNRQKDPDTFEAYRSEMERFALTELRHGGTGRNDSLLYENFIHSVPEGDADILADMLCTWEVNTGRPDLTAAIVSHNELAEGMRFPMKRGSALIRRYTEDAQIVFLTADGRRVSLGGSFRMIPMIRGSALLESCGKAGAGGPGILLRKTRRNEASLQEWLLVEGSPRYSGEWRARAREEILRESVKAPEKAPFSASTTREDLALYAKAGRKELFEILLRRKLYGRAWEVMRMGGPEGLDPKGSLFLLNRAIRMVEGARREDLVQISSALFRIGITDEWVLRYLVQYTRGSMEEMTAIRDAAAACSLDTEPLEERILSRAIFTGQVCPKGGEILKNFSESGGRARLVSRYLELESSVSFDRDAPYDACTAEVAADYLAQGGRVPVIRLAYLRYLAGQETLTAREENLADRILAEMTARGYMFSWYQKLPRSLLVLHHLEDKVIIEYRGDPEAKVTLRYALAGEEQDIPEERYSQEEMPLLFRNVFSRVFTLFYGEMLTYEIQAVSGEKTDYLPKRTVMTPFADLNGQSAYQRINRILYEAGAGNAEEAAALFRDLRIAQDTVRRLFVLER